MSGAEGEDPANGAELVLHHVPVLPAGVLEGRSLVGVRVADGSRPEPGALLRFRTSLPCRILSVRRIEPAQDVPPAAVGPRLQEYPLAVPHQADGRPAYEVRWVVEAVDDRIGAAGEEMLLSRLELTGPGRPGEDRRIVARGLLAVAWTEPYDPVPHLPLLSTLDPGRPLPDPLAAAVAALVRADAASLPSCPRCAPRWEAELLTCAERLWDTADRYGDAGIARALARWIPTTDGRDLVRPCGRCSPIPPHTSPALEAEWEAAAQDARRRADATHRRLAERRGRAGSSSAG
ncbi:hypothetical protein [Kitasatospora camelliae]|uniref:Uncharacterized protein n=1 Tax=Kitasatospora camelliae TaxID=3156397 RepID=A0AAU8K3T5_9ACTN